MALGAVGSVCLAATVYVGSRKRLGKEQCEGNRSERYRFDHVVDDLNFKG
jgi:hypothetical protein